MGGGGAGCNLDFPAFLDIDDGDIGLDKGPVEVDMMRFAAIAS